MAYTFPKQVSRYDRSPAGALSLAVIEGALPADLSGFVYVVAPTGRTVESPGRAGAIPFLNGNGTVYRLSFGASPELRWALTKPPCYWAEIALPPDQVTDWGITRLFDDLSLGGRNLLNTAFQAVRFAGGKERLLVTYEAGRPFEIDPQTLEVLTPVGRRDTWIPAMMPRSIFQVVAGTSHPAFDPGTDAKGGPGPGTLYSLCFVRDPNLYMERMLRFLGLDDEYEKTVKVLGSLGARVERTTALIELAARSPRGPIELLDFWPEITQQTLAAWKEFEARLPFATEPTGRLLFWDGANEPEWVTLRADGGGDFVMSESGHQMAVTDRYVVLMDAAFKFEMDEVLPELTLPKEALALVRRRFSRVQPQSVKVHLVPRAQLTHGASVEVETFEVPASCVHYFVDRDDSAGKVVMTVIDNAGCDPAEFLLADDSPAFLAQSDMPVDVHGMIPCGIDVDRIVRFELDLATGTVTKGPEAAETDSMWTLALATGPGQFTAAPPAKVDDLYLFTHGLLPEAVSQLIWDLYDAPAYTRRIVSRADVANLAAAGGIAPRILRYSAATPTTVADSYVEPAGWLLLSPQCVPGGTGGYVVTTAFSETEKQIWIFDGADLAKGPIAKLAPPTGATLPWGYTLHTTWLASADAPDPAGYRVTVADDLVGITDVGTIQFVNQEVAPHAYKPTAPPAPPVPRSEARTALVTLRDAYTSSAARHLPPLERTLDDALARFELTALASVDRAQLAEALADTALEPYRQAALGAHEQAVARIVTAFRALDRLVLPTAFPETEMLSVIARLGSRALSLWGSTHPESEVRTVILSGMQTLAGLVRADRTTPERSALSRAITLRRLGASVPADLEAERRYARTLVDSMLGL